MNQKTLIFYHRIFFIGISLLSLLFFSLKDTKNDFFEIVMAVSLFFLLGIPHGSLDIAVAKIVFEPKYGKHWKPLFFSIYILLIGLTLVFWYRFPLFSFLFFLLISSLHFGFSDIEKKGKASYIEAILRGLLPIVIPAHFYPFCFQMIIESSLERSDALFTLNLLEAFFVPTFILTLIFIAFELFNGLINLFTIINSNDAEKKLNDIYNGLEILTILIVFIFLKPFTAFIIYFCFLHSIRHIFNVLKESGQEINLKALRWVQKEAFAPTVIVLLVSFIFYMGIADSWMDQKSFFNLFFAGLAALTLPHMLLIEST